MKDFWNTINGQKVSTNILKNNDVRKERIKGKEIILINVSQASYQQKPVYINDNPFKGTFKRNHEGDYHCSVEEVKAMIRDASDAGNDGSILDGYTMEDIDSETLRAYRIEYKMRNPDHIWNNLDDKEFLRNLGAYATDRVSKKEGLTTAGLLMFGKGLSIRERFDNIQMDYLDQTSLKEGQRWSDRITYDGRWENNLYNFMKRIIPKLVVDLRRPFHLEGMARYDDTAVHKAVREAVVNLIIHSDYMITGVLKVIKTNNGFVFSNPGTLKLPIREIYRGGNSKARNPRIQTMLRMIGMGDNIGSGFPTILEAWRKENWRKPDLSENMDLHQVTLKLWMVSLMPKECIDFLHNLLGKKYQELNDKEQIILATAVLEKEVSNTRLQSILDIHPVEIGKLLSGLVQQNILLTDGKGRWMTYKINEQYKNEQTQMTLEDYLLEEEMNETDKFIYSFLLENTVITSKQVIENTRITSVAGATKALKRMIKKGLAEKIREGNTVYYKLKNRD